MTCDIWQMTRFFWGGGNILLRFGRNDLLKIWRKRVTQLLNQLINNNVFRTAPALKGLFDRLWLRTFVIPKNIKITWFFTSYSDFGKWVDFAFRWSWIGKGLHLHSRERKTSVAGYHCYLESFSLSGKFSKNYTKNIGYKNKNKSHFR